MNERIKQLAVAAAPANSSIPHSEWNIPKEFIEKFAELIVNDCITTLNKRFMGDLNREDMEVRRCIEDVKKHFGVKE